MESHEQFLSNGRRFNNRTCVAVTSTNATDNGDRSYVTRSERKSIIH